jgi:hypothetical protein
VAKIHETLRDPVRVFEGLAENAQAFMAGVACSIELQQAEAGAVASYKRLIDHLERFMGDLAGPLSNFPKTPAPRSRKAALPVRAARTALWLLCHFGPVACRAPG